MPENDKPSWGKTIGMFFACGMVAIAACIIVSATMVSQMGYSGYSNGGLMSTVTAVGCAAYYRSTGKVGLALGAAAVIGVVLGFLAVQMAKQAAGI